MKRLLVPLLLSAAASTAVAQDAPQLVLHLLDYVAADYPGAVAEGRVTDDAEFREMCEFTVQAIELVRALPADPGREALVREAARLAEQVEHKAQGREVAAAARDLRLAIIDAYRVETSPPRPPDAALGRRIYAENCAACHGVAGRGDGWAAPGLDPAPSDFHDATRMGGRSLYGLYSTVTLGVAGTSMASFELLTDEERWSVADYIARFPAGGQPSGLDRASRLLAASVEAYRGGQSTEAQRLAIQAYLDGFEPVEASLAGIDAALLREVEARMAGLRGALGQGAPVAEVERRADEVESLLARARERLDRDGLSPLATFSASFLILLREGLEAILVLSAVLAAVKRAGRRDALRYVHVGWIVALGAGLLTWFAATYVIDVSGADREITEGVTALIAAGMLVYVGYWLHNKAHAQAWARFVREQVGSALGRRTWWAMGLVAFLAVYREVFEVVLFYQALWTQAATQERQAFYGGLLAAAAALGAIAWLIFRYSVRMPVAPFFALSALLLAAMAVVFAGQGVAALQEAGVVSITPVSSFTAPVIGVFPTAQTLAAQTTMAFVVLVIFLRGRGDLLRFQR